MLAAGGIAFRGERGAVSGEMGISLGWIHGAAPLGYTPGILYEYQNKGVTKIAFRNCMKSKGGRSPGWEPKIDEEHDSA
ncbi:MAG TPA: hypothetical protein VF935_06690 [Candidatus Acidoferrum sp.]